MDRKWPLLLEQAGTGGSNPFRSANESLSPGLIRLTRRNSPRVGAEATRAMRATSGLAQGTPDERAQRLEGSRKAAIMFVFVIRWRQIDHFTLSDTRQSASSQT